MHSHFDVPNFNGHDNPDHYRNNDHADDHTNDDAHYLHNANHHANNHGSMPPGPVFRPVASNHWRPTMQDLPIGPMAR